MIENKILELKIYNTLNRKKENFIPQNKDEVTMYVCGPTVYNFSHIGNARPAVVFDTLFRLLKVLYPKVKYARNITDIDDKILLKAKEENKSTEDITNYFYKIYMSDMSSLNVSTPTLEPWATKYIPEIIKIIKVLIKKNYAYVNDNHVLFNVPSFKNYGLLSKQDRLSQIAGARVEVAPYKKDPTDFILWKPSDENQIGWNSPWGRGRPGWHIECSAMIEAIFGGAVDIHGGGVDLIFPHHENEIAQSTCFHDEHLSCAKYFMHNGFVRIDNEKMSKSLGNVFLVNELLKEYNGETLRLSLLLTHYRSPLDFSNEILLQSKNLLNRFYETLKHLEEVEISHAPQVKQTAAIAAVSGHKTTKESVSGMSNDKEAEAGRAADKVAVSWRSAGKAGVLGQVNSKEAMAEAEIENTPEIGNAENESFIKAMCDDLNISEAIAIMYETTNQIFKTEDLLTKQKLGETFKAMAKVLGILESKTTYWFQNLKINDINIIEIEELIKQRLEARNSKNFARADEIRLQLEKKGILIKDMQGKTEWYRK